MFDGSGSLVRYIRHSLDSRSPLMYAGSGALVLDAGGDIVEFGSDQKFLHQ